MTRKFSQLTAILVFSFINITTLPTTVKAQGWDESVLCVNRKYATQFRIRTKRFDAAICYTGYDDERGCYIPTKYFYIGHDRKTGALITLPAVEERSNILVYKARSGNYTYQMASSGGYTHKPWTSLSVFSNGKKIYSEVMNSYYGFYDC